MGPELASALAGCFPRNGEPIPILNDDASQLEALGVRLDGDFVKVDALPPRQQRIRSAEILRWPAPRLAYRQGNPKVCKSLRFITYRYGPFRILQEELTHVVNCRNTIMLPAR